MRFQTHDGLGLRSSSVSGPPDRYRSCQRWKVALGMPSLSNLRLVGSCDPSTRRMISSFSDAGYLIRHPPIRDHAFSGSRSLRACSATTSFRSRAFRRRSLTSPDVAARQALLPSLEEFLGPTVTEALGNAFTAAQISNAALALQAVLLVPAFTHIVVLTCQNVTKFAMLGQRN